MVFWHLVYMFYNLFSNLFSSLYRVFQVLFESLQVWSYTWGKNIWSKRIRNNPNWSFSRAKQPCRLFSGVRSNLSSCSSGRYFYGNFSYFRICHNPPIIISQPPVASIYLLFLFLFIFLRYFSTQKPDPKAPLLGFATL